MGLHEKEESLPCEQDQENPNIHTNMAAILVLQQFPQQSRFTKDQGKSHKVHGYPMMLREMGRAPAPPFHCLPGLVRGKKCKWSYINGAATLLVNTQNWHHISGMTMRWCSRIWATFYGFTIKLYPNPRVLPQHLTTDMTSPHVFAGSDTAPAVQQQP